ncbi:hypothetical protein [Mesobacillus thioparans]|uniref:hypothetical protein n=1 Tax=Mesobacillus thioparans TaxID=370439 RepID=UPI0039F07C71
MTRVYYHVLGAATFCFGLLLLIKLPGESALLGEKLLNYSMTANWSTIKNTPFVPLFAALIQVIGILLIAVWLKKEKSGHYEFYKRWEPAILAILLLAVPFLLNETLGTAAKTFAFSGKKGPAAVEYIKDKSSCHLSEQESSTIECYIILKNYQHHSQQLAILTIPWQEKASDNQIFKVHLGQRQEKKIHLTLSKANITQSQLNQIAKGLAPDLQIIKAADAEKRS